MTKQTNKKVAYTLATHAAEKLTPSRDAMQLCRQTASGRISADAAVLRIKQKYGVGDRRTNG